MKSHKLILEPYKSTRKLEAKISHGMATIAQKNNVVGLKLLMDFNGVIGSSFYISLSKGATVYIREEILHTQEWAKKTLESDVVEGPFIIVDPAYMEFADEQVSNDRQA